MISDPSCATKSESRWNKLIKELSNILFFWFFGVVFFTVFRFVFIAIFRQELGDNIGYSDYLSVFNMGLKFDCSAIAYFLMIPFVLALTLSYFNKFGINPVLNKIYVRKNICLKYLWRCFE